MRRVFPSDGPNHTLVEKGSTSWMARLPEGVPEAVMDAFSIVEALYALGGSGSASDSLSGVEERLRADLCDRLLMAARRQRGPLARQFELRASALASRSYDEVASYTAGLTKPDWLLIIGEPTRPLEDRPAMSALLFETTQTDMMPFRRIEDEVIRIARADQVSAMGDWASRPRFLVGERVLAAGGWRGMPQHFANFMPEDEGTRGTELTLAYRGYYSSRIEKVSVPSAAAHIGGTKVDAQSLDSMLCWFRGHDVAHTLYDPLCFGLAGFSGPETHALRELLADLVGYEAVVASGVVENQATFDRLYISELLRYASRDDGRRFADALASKVQLGTLTSPVDGLKMSLGTICDRNSVAEMLSTLRELLVALARQGDVARLSHLIEKRSDLKPTMRDVLTAPDYGVLHESADMFVEYERARGKRATRAKVRPAIDKCTRVI